jgi:hypothetical protein
MCCPANWIGRLGRIAWSLPKAIFEPQKETEPITVETRIGTRMSSGMLPAPLACRNSDHEIRAAAPPPTPL